MKTVDEREMRKATKEKQAETERSKGTEEWELNDFAFHLS